MVTDWQEIGDTKYYFDAGGAMRTGWLVSDGSWYYLNGSGAMITNCWISGTYYMKADGRMAVSEWVDNDRYYVDSNGAWVPNKENEDIRNAALAWIVLDEETNKYHNSLADVKAVYIDDEGKYQFQYEAEGLLLYATGSITFSPVYPHIYYRKLPDNQVMEVCAWVFNFKPEYNVVKTLNIPQIAMQKAELQKEQLYVITN